MPVLQCASCFPGIADTEGPASLASKVAMDQAAIPTTAATGESRHPPFSTIAFNQRGQAKVPEGLMERMAKSAGAQHQSMAATGWHSHKEHKLGYQIRPSAEPAAFATPGVNGVPFNHPTLTDAGGAAFGSAIPVRPFTGATASGAAHAEPSEPDQAARKFVRP